MNFTVTTENLLGGLRRVMSAVSAKPVIPILNNILFEAKKGQLYLTGFDTEMRIKTAITAVVTEEGAVTLQAKKFNEIVGKLSSGDVLIATDPQNAETVHLSCQKFECTLTGLKASDYPIAEVFKEDWGFGISGKELVDSLCKVVYARSEDESRKALNGVLFSIRGGMRTVAATDGRRLALVEKAIEAAEAAKDGAAPAPAVPTQEGEFILPEKVVFELIKSLDQSKNVMLHLTRAMAVFETGDTTIMSKLVELTYPNYRSVIPVSFSQQVSIPRALFADVLKRVSSSISDSENSGSVKLDIQGTQMVISASSPENGESHESMDVTLTGNPIVISFNPQFLLDPIKTLTCDQFVLKFNDGVTPVEMTGDPGSIYILMPMRN